MHGECFSPNDRRVELRYLFVSISKHADIPPQVCVSVSQTVARNESTKWIAHTHTLVFKYNVCSHSFAIVINSGLCLCRNVYNFQRFRNGVRILRVRQTATFCSTLKTSRNCCTILLVVGWSCPTVDLYIAIWLRNCLRPLPYAIDKYESQQRQNTIARNAGV